MIGKSRADGGKIIGDGELGDKQNGVIQLHIAGVCFAHQQQNNQQLFHHRLQTKEYILAQCLGLRCEPLPN